MRKVTSTGSDPVTSFQARHASTMLTFDAVVDAIGQIEAKASNKAAEQKASQPASA